MSDPVAPRTGPDPVLTYQLLAAIDTHGPSWPKALDRYAIDAVSDAISRETAAGNLRGGAVLTERGRQLVVDLRAQRRSAGT